MMCIHRIQGRDVEDALRRARATFGDDAVVLAQEGAAGGGVILSVTDGQARRALSADPERVLRPVERPRELVPRRHRSAREGEGADLLEVRERLASAGCSADLAEEVLGPVRAMAARGVHAIDAAARVIAGLLRPAATPRHTGHLRLLTVVGPTGAGKTTSLAKLAVPLLRSGRRVALATLDTYRAGAVDQLRAYAEALQVPLLVARGGAELAGAAEQHADLDVLLVDTTGRSPLDTENLTRLARDLEVAGRAAELDAYLVLSASMTRAALLRARDAFAVLAPQAAILTKLDETREAGVALEFCRDTGLAPAFLCDGQDVARNLHRAAPGAIADLLLRGKVA